MAKTKKLARNCSNCGLKIAAERLEVLPETMVCIECARQSPEPVRFDPDVVCAKSSLSGGNGWSPKD